MLIMSSLFIKKISQKNQEKKTKQKRSDKKDRLAS